MTADTVSPFSLVSTQQSYYTDKELVNDPGIEPIPCNPDHFCSQCGHHWNRTEPLAASSEHLNPAEIVNDPLEEVNQRPNFHQRCGDCYKKYPRRHWTVLGVVAIVVAIIVGLAVHFRPRPLSGIYRHGTGLVVLDRGDNSPIVDVFFQHEDGTIRHSVFDDEKKEWSDGGPQNKVLSPYAPPPREGTSLMAVSYKIWNETTWRVFYIDTNNILQESIASTTTDQFPLTWSTGSLGLSTFKAHPSPHTGLSVCRNMLWSPDPSGLNNGSLLLFYGGADGKNRMLTHEIQDTAWRFNYTFEDSTAESGVECTCRGDEIVDSWMIDTQGRLSQASFNFNLTSNKTTYVSGQWKIGSFFDASIQGPTSISAIKYTGNDTSYAPNSTFVYLVTRDSIVTSFNIDTSDRSDFPAAKNDSCTISDVRIVSGSKIASVTLRTNKINTDDKTYDEENLIILQPARNPGQMFVTSADFHEKTFVLEGNGSNIQN